MMDETVILSLKEQNPCDGGCWFCCHEIGSYEHVFCREFDCYIHMMCLKRQFENSRSDPSLLEQDSELSCILREFDGILQVSSSTGEECPSCNDHFNPHCEMCDGTGRI